jgi:hypothetical protein
MKRRAKAAPEPAEPEPRSRHRVLTVSRRSGRYLHDADALSEFDAVIVDQLMELLLRDGVLIIEPGLQQGVPQVVLGGLRLRMVRRTEEAAALLLGGGIVVIRLRPLAQLLAQPSGYSMNPGPDTYTSADWWIGLDERLTYLRHDQGVPLIHKAAGPPGQVEDPGHSLEPYLRDARYTAVLDAVVTNTPNSTILAINRGGEALAAQIKMGAGLLLIVPSDGDEALLGRCVGDLLDLRTAHRTEWRLPAEQEALAELSAADLDFRARRASALARLADVWAQKDQVLKERTVKRVLDYYRVASADATSRRTSVARLHSMVEVIEDEVGGESALRSTLALSKKTVENIKHLANKPEVDARHVDSGESRDITDEEMAAALGAAAMIVQAYVQYRVGLLQPDGS